MVDKQKYIKRFKELYEFKNKKVISDDFAFEHFEKLVCLIGAITSHVEVKKLIIQEKL